MYISTKNELLSFIERAIASPILAIDTEFMREKTYYPQLCLLQMATDKEDVIVDPFTIETLEPLSKLLANNDIVKVFHAGRQDIEIIYQELGMIPEPLFDTQIAAALLGYTLQVGYASLVQSVCGVTLKKGDSFTDWARRPLSHSQLSYASDDVRYLPELYRVMNSRLAELDRLSWVEDDFTHLANPSHYEIDPMERFKRLKRVNQLTRKQLSAARELAAWRERMAQSKNIPRKWLLSDEQVVEACRREASTIDQLYMVRGIAEKLNTKDAREAVAAITRGLSVPKESWPSVLKKSRNEMNVDVQVDALSAIARLRAKENNIAFQALVSISDLTDVARGYTDCDVLHGWRNEIVGKDLRAFMEGKLQIAIEQGSLKVTKRQ